MRNERGITLVAVVVMLCCVGSVSKSMPVSHSNALIARVIVHAHSNLFEEPSSDLLAAPEQASSCVLCMHVPVQIEIDENHNLPPPTVQA